MSDETTNKTAFDNSAYNTHSVLSIRLDTEQVLLKVKSFLSGQLLTEEYDKETGLYRAKYQQFGEKLCNAKGEQHIVNYVGSIINSQVVQGNYTSDMYDYHVMLIHKDLTLMIVRNNQEWDINVQDRLSIVSFIMNLVSTFLSRLLENKERESYAQTVKVSESVHSDKQNIPMN